MLNVYHVNVGNTFTNTIIAHTGEIIQLASHNAVIVKPGLIHGTPIILQFQFLHHVLLAWLDQQRL